MSDERANKSEMYELHSAVAEVLLQCIRDKEEVSAAILSAAIRFLKDNNITTVIEDDEAMSELQKLLDTRKYNSVQAVPVEDEFALP